MNNLDKINWMTVTNNIMAKYKPLSQVAKEVGSDWQHLNRLARGEVMKTSWPVGIRLLDIHYDHCPDRHSLDDLCR